MANPFFANIPVPPEYFIGRTSEITAAFDTIHARSHLAIWGGPGMGKTSYLDKVACPQTWKEYGLDSSPAVIVLFSCQSLYPFTPGKFWAEILTIMDDKLKNEPELQTEIRNLRGNNITNDTLRQAITKLGRKNKFLVLLVDDFDAALETNGEYTESDRETFLAQCRSLAVHGANKKLTMIVTSLQRLNEIGPPLKPNASPWYNHYMYQSLKKFDYQETEQLLSVFPPELRNGIRNITGSHPTLIQIAGFLLYIARQQGEEVDINKFNSDFERDFERDTKQIFETIWKRCNDQQKTLLMLIVLLYLDGHLEQKDFDLKGIGRILNQNERSLTELEEQGVIVSEIRPKPKLPKEKEKIYLFTSSIMKKWVIQEIWNTKPSEIRKREKVFLNLMSHGQVEEMKKAITWSGQHQDTVVSLLKLGRDILFG
ncbi:ATP-binding protein [Dolichospermum sp. FACHB-1091]|uniref:ATP-binding protein n=1 Tax=Dolichospermum sp. FACHB-1091 TaxID=2692798 RepID=UPI0016817FFB|nr:ATP-binding protein [Dolichospermum sp. FACHB-1091]MBD2443743.1 ATP-binding protein [Dolichospermum sp. FACHB-1091]